MFTGLVEEVGIVLSSTQKSGITEIEIAASTVLADLRVDHSINVNGVCQTVVRTSAFSFTVQAVRETIRKTTLGTLKRKSRVNLERAVQPTTRLGGHFVQGHVDGTARVASILKQPGNWKITVALPPEFMRFVVPIGSICIDGVSLTVASTSKNSVTIAIIPHTLEVTTLGDLKRNSSVNIELDLLGKYVAQLIDVSGTNRR